MNPMQIRHTNGKIYKVKDLTTLVRWVGEKRVPRQCMVRDDEGEWQQAMAIPEVAEAFAMLDARRRQGSNSPAAIAPEAVAAVVDAASQPVEPTAITAAVPDVAQLPAEPNEDDAAALEAALESEFTEPLDTDGAGDTVEAAESVDIPTAEPVADTVADDGEDHSFDDAFELLEEMTQEPSDVPGLAADDDETSEIKKKSKAPLVAGIAVAAIIGGYLATSGDGSAPDPLSGDDPAAQALRASYERGLEALASGESERMTGALAGLEPAMCLKGCDGSQCVKDKEGDGCSINKDAAAFTPFFLLYDRLWLESNQTNTNLQDHVGAVIKTLSAQAEAPFGKERMGAFADYWNATQPKVDEASNKSALLINKVIGAIPEATDTPVYVALKQLDGNAAAKATELLAQATKDPEKKPDSRLMKLAEARLARAEAQAKGCGPVNEAYLAAVKGGLPSAGRELALFLATNGDLKGAALAAGKAADSDPLLKAIVTAAALGAEATDKELLNKYKAQNAVTMRKSKKVIKFLYGKLAQNPDPNETRGNLLAGIHEMFPNAVKEGLEGAWIAISLGQAAEGEVKAKHGAMAAKRFDRILAADPNRRDALLGRAAAGLLTGEAAKHQAHAFAWLFVQPGVDKPACKGQDKAADQPPAK